MTYEKTKQKKIEYKYIFFFASLSKSVIIKCIEIRAKNSEGMNLVSNIGLIKDRKGRNKL